MKVDQKNETNMNTVTTRLSDASNYLNMELSTSDHLSNTGPEPGILSQLNSPFTCIV
jgi:hypothetical protein